MSNRRGRRKRHLPITNGNEISHDDKSVLQKVDDEPLERGGIYSEMGADFTYEESLVSDDYRARLTHFKAQEDTNPITPYWYIGVLAIVFGIISLFIWPFWMSLATAGLTVISYYQGTKSFAYISGALAIFSFLVSLTNY